MTQYGNGRAAQLGDPVIGREDDGKLLMGSVIAFEPESPAHIYVRARLSMHRVLASACIEAHDALNSALPRQVTDIRSAP